VSRRAPSRTIITQLIQVSPVVQAVQEVQVERVELEVQEVQAEMEERVVPVDGEASVEQEDLAALVVLAAGEDLEVQAVPVALVEQEALEDGVVQVDLAVQVVQEALAAREDLGLLAPALLLVARHLLSTPTRPLPSSPPSPSSLFLWSRWLSFSFESIARRSPEFPYVSSITCPYFLKF
jgi:hypothetical protein